jgi:threonine synthase
VQTGGLVDPHTAVALAVADKMTGPADGTPLVILSTAHPAKFPKAVRTATGLTPPRPAAARRVGALPERFDRLRADPAAVKAYVRAFADA